MAEILAAGAVLWRWEGGSGVEVALVHRPRYDDWSLPKGKLEPGESIWAAAVREVVEETGFTATLGRWLGRVSYRIGRAVPTIKTVEYFAARTVAGRFQPNKEVDRLRWLPQDEAENLLTYQGDQEMLRAFRALPADTTTLALVRHARAGHRARWPGPDELRPLTDEGWRQAAALRALLPLFGVDRVHSATQLRCVQTVQGLADDLGAPAILEPLLSEQGYLANVTAAVARVHEIAASGGTPLVCSQGGVIPDLLSRLAENCPLILGSPESAKGSAWILSLTMEPIPTLAAAYYIANPETPQPSQRRTP